MEVTDKSKIETVLIVDDMEVNRVLLRRIFDRDYAVLEAPDGEQALAILHEMPQIGVVLLDINMPRMNGYDVLKAMMEDAALCRIPVIVVTASEEDATVLKAFDLGACEVVTRPYNPGVVRCRVKNILRRMQSERIAEQNRIYEQRLRIAETDEKTGLYNKYAFCSHVSDVLQNDPNGEYIILRWDIDHFKAFNDMYGTTQGDRLLKAVGDFYNKNRYADILVCGRWDADHFVTLRKRDGFDPACIQQEINRYIGDQYPEFDFVCQIGIYEITDPFIDVVLMCDRALLALRSVKNNFSLHIAWYNASMRQSMIEEQEIGNEMKIALAKGQFQVYYQPQYNYFDGSLYGIEADVRWVHPRKGILLPEKFIPVFERNGFISALDRFVWEQTCGFLRECLDNAVKITPISVKVSRYDIYNTRLCEILLGLVEQYDIPVSMLQLEITESAYMEDPEQMIKTVNELREHGFYVQMDDFGSGYSSLNTLKDVPVDLLKLDKKFISECGEGSRGGSILNSVVRMAHAIKLPVIAEGVETRMQAEYLKSIGCYYMQGSFFANSMSAHSLLAMLKKGKTSKPDKRFTTGIDGAADFLNPDTQIALLFNSFVGAAGIFEYDGKKVEALRLNDNYFETIGVTRSQYDGWCSRILERFSEKYRLLFINTLEQAILTGKETSCELCTKRLISGVGNLWINARVRFLSGNDGIYLFYIAVENITERTNLLMHNMELSERMFRILHNLPVGVAIYEIGDKIVPIYISDRVCEMFGFTRKEYDKRIATGKPINFMPNLADWPSVNISDLLKGKLIEMPKVHVQRKDGSWFWLRVESRAEKQKGKLPICYAVLTDITDRINEEQKYLQQQMDMSALISAIPGGIFKYSAEADEQFSYVSDNMIEMLGFTREEFNLKFKNRFSEMVCIEDRKRVLKEIDDQISSGAFDTCIYRIETKSGNLKWVYDKGHLVTDGDGKKHFVVVVLDMRDHMLMEQQLCREKLRTCRMFSHTPSGSMKLTAAADGSLKVKFASTFFHKLMGYTQDKLLEIYEHDCYALVCPDDIETTKHKLIAALKGAYDFQCRLRVRSKSGEYIAFQVNVYLCEQNNSVNQVPKGNTDIYITYSPVPKD